MWRKVAYLKVWFGGAGAYLGFINFILLMLTFKQSYNIPIKAHIVLIIGFILTMLIGIFDYYFIMKHQNSIANQVNDLKEQMDRIESKLQ